MRVTGQHLLDRAAIATSRAQTKVGQTSTQLASGERLQAPSDDPAAWAIAARARARAAMSAAAGAGIATSNDGLATTDGALASLTEAYTRARELAIEGASDNFNAGDRARLALELEALFTSAVGIANARTPDGEYVLAGSASRTAPFDATGAYLGDGNTRQVATSEGAVQLVTVPGTALTAASGLDVLPALARAAAAFAANDRPGIDASLDELARSIDQLASARSQVGSAMAVLRDVDVARGAFEDRLATIAGAATDADPVATATAFAQAGQALQTAQAVSTSIASLLRVG